MSQLLTVSAQFPLITRGLSSVERACAWVLDGLAETPFLPSRLRISLKQAAKSARQETQTTLPADCVHQSVLSLPRSVRRNIANAVSLQLDELSPFPVADVASVYRVLAVEKDRIRVAVAFARQSEIDAHKMLAEDASPHSVVADCDEDGELFVFKKIYAPITRARLMPFLLIGAVTISLLSLMLAVSFRFDHELVRLQATEQHLLASAKSVREELAEMDSILDQRQVLQSRIALSEFVKRFDTLSEGAPPSLRLSTFGHDQAGTTYTGHLRNEEMFAVAEFREVSRASDASRPGWTTITGVYKVEVSQK